MSLLNHDRQQVIDTKIDELLMNTGLFYPEDTLLSITSKLGLKVAVTDLSFLGRGVSGVIIPVDAEVPQDTILIAKSEPMERRNFTLAHELGHYILHGGGVKLRIDKYDYKLDSKESNEETEANYFAASLLMPKDLFIRVLRASTVEATAAYFAVSNSAVRIRERWLRTN
jgi:hypothetical protein